MESDDVLSYERRAYIEATRGAGLLAPDRIVDEIDEQNRTTSREVMDRLNNIEPQYDYTTSAGGVGGSITATEIREMQRRILPPLVDSANSLRSEWLMDNETADILRRISHERSISSASSELPEVHWRRLNPDVWGDDDISVERIQPIEWALGTFGEEVPPPRPMSDMRPRPMSDSPQMASLSPLVDKFYPGMELE